MQMKTIKKSLALFFSIMMLISAIPISATAEENLKLAQIYMTVYHYLVN